MCMEIGSHTEVLLLFMFSQVYFRGLALGWVIKWHNNTSTLKRMKVLDITAGNLIDLNIN